MHTEFYNALKKYKCQKNHRSVATISLQVTICCYHQLCYISLQRLCMLQCYPYFIARHQSITTCCNAGDLLQLQFASFQYMLQGVVALGVYRPLFDVQFHCSHFCDFLFLCTKFYI